MCGIAGFVDVSISADDAPRALTRMLSSIRHRGPDEHGIYFDQRCGLGTARLSIIDLASGSQPMTDGRLVLAFNGEIFNYLELREELERAGRVFRTRSDTEVLLHALATWGEEALQRVNGQFAFASWDRKAKRMLMARDRFGERPLFFARHASGLVFGSEIKAVFALPFVRRALSPVHVRRAYRLWTVLFDETCFDGVDQIAPGHLLSFADGKAEARPYYRLPLGRREISAPGAVEQVRARLDQSVRLRLRSDVEVGTYASGGLDSTITTFLAQKHNEKEVQTFAIGFDDAAYDETAYQELVRARFGTRHHAVRISRNDIAETFPAVVWHAETALFRTAPVPMYLLAKQVRDAGIKVVLTGEGADEAFLGYDLFKETLFRERFKSLAQADRLESVRTLYPYLPHFTEANSVALLRAFEPHTEEKTPGLFSHEMRFANARFAVRLLQGDEGDDPRVLADELVRRYPDLLAHSLMERAQIIEYATLLAGYLLSSQGDRMTSAFGVEARCPFLDHEVVELAMSLPVDLRLRDGTDEKHILKAAFFEALPKPILSRPKQPYRAPDAAAFVAARGVEWLDQLDRRSHLATVRDLRRKDHQCLPRPDDEASDGAHLTARGSRVRPAALDDASPSAVRGGPPLARLRALARPRALDRRTDARMSIEIRRATDADAPAVVDMLAEHWAEHGWSLGKYRHYYRDYPEGPPISMIAVDTAARRPVAHFGVLPIRISGIPAGLILQVLVRQSHRRGNTLVELARASEGEARRTGARLLVGFANARFAKVAERFLRWRILGYLGFSDTEAIELEPHRHRYHFEYGDAWYRWKFGHDARIYVKPYEKDGATYHQLLKTRDFPRVEANTLGAPRLNLWRPEEHLVEPTGEWSQPLVLVPLAPGLPEDLAEFSRWYVEMGDSDTFEPHQPWRGPQCSSSET